MKNAKKSLSTLNLLQPLLHHIQLTTKEIERVSKKDEELSRIKNCIMSGKWDTCEDTAYKAISTDCVE